MSPCLASFLLCRSVFYWTEDALDSCSQYLKRVFHVQFQVTGFVKKTRKLKDEQFGTSASCQRGALVCSAGFPAQTTSRSFCMKLLKRRFAPFLQSSSINKSNLCVAAPSSPQTYTFFRGSFIIVTLRRSAARLVQKTFKILEYNLKSELLKH